MNVETFIREQVLTYLKKNKDYVDSFNKSLDKHGDKAYIIRAEDKVSRFIRLSSSFAEVQDEKVEDTVCDLFNYTAMFIAWKENSTLLDIVRIMYVLSNNGFQIFANVLMKEGLASLDIVKQMIDVISKKYN